MNSYTVSVVIPTYNTWDLTDKLLSQLSQHELANIDQFVVVDDGSVAPKPETIPSSWTAVLPKNVGFTLACNHGLKLATKPVASKHLIFLISNDVQIKGKFIERAADELFGARRAFVGNKMIGWDSGWNTFNGVTFNYLEGFFLACTSDGWRDIDYFDKNYAPFDYEDVDISQTAKSKGYNLVALNNPNIAHQGGGTLGYTPERRAVTERNREYFKSKWVK